MTQPISGIYIIRVFFAGGIPREEFLSLGRQSTRSGLSSRENRGSALAQRGCHRPPHCPRIHPWNIHRALAGTPMVQNSITSVIIGTGLGFCLLVIGYSKGTILPVSNFTQTLYPAPHAPSSIYIRLILREDPVKFGFLSCNVIRSRLES